MSLYTEARASLFLEMLRKSGGHVAKAAKAAGICRRTAYNWRDTNDEFAKAWDETQQAVIDDAEAEVRRRAIEGVLRPQFYQGKKVASVREWSDNLLMFWLKRHVPEYRENYRADNPQDPVDAMIDARLAYATMRANPDLATMTDKRLAELVAQQFNVKAEHLLASKSGQDMPTQETETIS